MCLWSLLLCSAEVAAKSYCCKQRVRVDKGRRIAPHYLWRDNGCAKNEETVADKMCVGIHP